jgi:hypothetical protein
VGRREVFDKAARGGTSLARLSVEPRAKYRNNQGLTIVIASHLIKMFARVNPLATGFGSPLHLTGIVVGST